MWSKSQGLLFKMQMTKGKNAEVLCFQVKISKVTLTYNVVQSFGLREPICSPTMCSHAPGEMKCGLL